ncbi:transporter [Dictyobacter formicarum]|uniref:Transporter n=1 Tax=Dictyobacter formicarum TaxID=2778368 RepID=A0ABQ3VFW5_9CHLR|nr:transporter [Dictyobacter formicarum]
MVNLVAALVGLWALTLAARPADEDHTYGHTKSEYFSSGVEGALILVAALVIAVESVPRLFHPEPIDQPFVGLAFSVFGAIINGALAWFMLQAGKKQRSITLEADAHHLFADVTTTVGVLVGVLMVAITHWYILDPIVALLVVINIIWTGTKLLRQTGLGLLDTALPREDINIINGILEPYRQQGIDFHAMRSRIAGQRRFVSFHVIVPGEWTVQKGHTICEEIEMAIRKALTDSTVFTHLEPKEDPVTFQDLELDRNTAEN